MLGFQVVHSAREDDTDPMIRSHSRRRSQTRSQAWGLSAFVLLVGLVAAVVEAAEPVNSSWRGIAIDGTDPVAYFTDGEPVEGDSAFTHEWRGATWRFASQEHRDLFAAAPEKYAPQFGGYCAWAVAQGKTAAIDPEAWKIVDGKLYLNYSRKIQRLWEEDLPAHIESGEKNWPGLVDDD